VCSADDAGIVDASHGFFPGPAPAAAKSRQA
jgi:hypothetical protein